MKASRVIACLLLIGMLAGLAACGTPAPAPAPAPAGVTEETALPATDRDQESVPTPTPAPLTLEEEDQLISEARESEDFGHGDKLAVYVYELDFNDWYSFHGAWVPEELRARSPEEIGAFLSYLRYEDGYLVVSLETANSSLAYNDGLYRKAYLEEALPLEEINGNTPLYDGGTLGEFVRKELPPLLELQARLESEKNGRIDQRRTAMAAEDRLIREAMEKEGFGFGSKLAVYVDTDDQYSFHGAWLPEELRAETPEEIGAFLCYELYEEAVSVFQVKGASGATGSYDSSLWAMPDGMPMLEEVDGSTRLFELGTLEEFLADSLPLLFERQAEILSSREESERRKLEEEHQRERRDSSRQEQLMDLLNDPSQSLELGNGAYFVGYNEDKGEYEMNRIPPVLGTSFPEEVGYILSYSSSWKTKTGKYTSGDLEVELETFKARILDAGTGNEIGSFTESATLPYVVMTRDGKADPEPIRIDTILENIKAAFKARHLEWPYED